MENATKALLIVASVLIGLIILSALLLLYNQVSGFYQSNSNKTEEQQRLEFNKKFESYENQEIRGNELLSIMNMVDDYNVTEPENGYAEMEFEVDFISTDLFKQFNYESANSNKYLLSGSNSKITENKLNDFSSRVNDPSTGLISTLQSVSGSVRITETLLQQLSSNIANIMVEETNSGASNEYEISNRNEARRKRANLLKNIFKVNVCGSNTTTYTTDPQYVDMVSTIKDVTLKYYEFTQFKRAHFDCIGLEYDSVTGRVNKMSFRVCTDSNGNIILN